jgi:transposase InsO family protein
MARDLCVPGWGRDKIEELLLSNGYRLNYPPNYTRTTYSQHDVYHPNLIEGLELDGINQVVQTDMTYYRVGTKFYYIVFLIDVYSRQIVGYSASKTMEAQANIRALKQLFVLRKGQDLTKLIHHSDRGSQYVDKEYRKLLTDRGIRMSMCVGAWENAYTERLNRTIKDEYLDLRKIASYESLVRHLRKAVRHYNHKRKHSSLGNEIPVVFEKKVENRCKTQKPKMRIYKPLQSSPQNKCEQ